MAIKTYLIDSILGGQSPLYHGGGKGQFLGSQAIDPEQGVSSRPSGFILPVSYATFSGAQVTGAPMWIMTTPNDFSGSTFYTFTYLSNGRLVAYDFNLATETLIGTATNGAGNGGAYYNNFVYMATPTDVSRYGPINATPTLTNNVWTGSTLGTQQTLYDTPMVTNRNAAYPNHPMHVHSDNFLYFGDFLDGRAVVHRIGTTDVPTLNYDTQTANFTAGLVITGATSGATARIVSDADAGATGILTLSKVTGIFVDNEIITDTGGGSAMVNGTLIDTGTTNNGSAYNVLDLPSNFKIFDIESFGTDLAIIGSKIGSQTGTLQGKSYLYLWDCVSDSFYREIPIPVNMCTAILNVNGALFIWGGTRDFGWSLVRYTGGFSVESLWTSQEGAPPYAGAVDVYGTRVVWGNYQTTVGGGANIISRGYVNAELGDKAINNIGIVANLASGTLPVITALKYVQQQQGLKRPIAGWRTSSDFGLSKFSGSAPNQSYFWTQNILVGQSFKIRGVRVPLSGPVTSTVGINIVAGYDDASNTGSLTTINNTNYPGQQFVKYNPPEIDAALAGTTGRNNFALQLGFDGTSQVGVALPIEITIETLDD